MADYKLYYFNARGWAELSRLILHYVGVEFEDIRFERSQWPEYKDKMPFKKAPVLEVNGKMLCQSHAIARYLARKHGLAGDNDWDQALADMYIDCMKDVMIGLTPAYMETDPEKKKELSLKYINEVVIPHLQIVEKQLEANGSGFLVGLKVTWADLLYFSWLYFLEDKFGHALKLNETPHMRKLVDHIANVPNIKKWIETRPQTET